MIDVNGFAQSGVSLSEVAPSVPPPSLPVLASRNIPGLNSLRALSVLLVMVSHYGFGTMVPGALGVTIFFFISGFLITNLLLVEAHTTGNINKKNFWIRRILRLHPELTAFIIVSAAIGIFVTGFPRWLDFASGLLYFSNYRMLFAEIFSWNLDFRWPHLWSLAVEEHYYLFYPIVFMALSKNPKAFSIALVLLCIGTLLWRCVLVVHFQTPRYAYEATDARLDSIAYGCLCALLLWWRGSDIRDVLGPKVKWFAALGLALLFASLTIRQPLFRDTFRYSLQGMALFALFIGLYLPDPDDSLLASHLEIPGLAFLGQISYAAYLWHFQPLEVVELGYGMVLSELPLFQRLATMFALCACTFAAAYVSHVLIAKPMLRFRRRFGSHQ